MIKSQTAATIAQRLAAGEELLLLDIREPAEWAIAQIDVAEQRSMSSLQSWWQELPHDREIVVICHHGGRSAHVCAILAQQAGLTNLTNMEGGIDSWSRDVDPTVPQY